MAFDDVVPGATGQDVIVLGTDNVLNVHYGYSVRITGPGQGPGQALFHPRKGYGVHSHGIADSFRTLIGSSIGIICRRCFHPAIDYGIRGIGVDHVAAGTAVKYISARAAVQHVIAGGVYDNFVRWGSL